MQVYRPEACFFLGRALKVCCLAFGTTIMRPARYCGQECPGVASARSSIPRRCNPIESMLRPSPSATDTSCIVRRALAQIDGRHDSANAVGRPSADRPPQVPFFDAAQHPKAVSYADRARPTHHPCGYDGYRGLGGPKGLHCASSGSSCPEVARVYVDGRIEANLVASAIASCM